MGEEGGVEFGGVGECDQRRLKFSFLRYNLIRVYDSWFCKSTAFPREVSV